MHIQMHQTSSWACSPTCVLKILIDPFPLSYILSPYVIYQNIFMFLSLYDISPSFLLYLLLSLFLSPFVINDHKGSKYR